MEPTSAAAASPTVASSASFKRNDYNTLKRNSILQEIMNGFLDKVKKASKGVVDAGAKTMLKVRVVENSEVDFHFGREIHRRQE